MTFWRSLSASDRAAAKLMAASANSGRPALSSIPGTATIAATAVVARPNLNSALIGNRIDGPLDTLALGPICHKGFALPLSLRRHFEEKLNQSFKKLVISGTATVFGSRVEALPLCGPRSPAALYGLAAARVVANRRAGGPDSIRDPANGGRGKSVAEIVLVLVARMIALENLAENILAVRNFGDMVDFGLVLARWLPRGFRDWRTAMLRLISVKGLLRYFAAVALVV